MTRILPFLLALLVADLAVAEGTNDQQELSMWLSVDQNHHLPIKGTDRQTHEILVTISNSSAQTVKLQVDGDRYRLMLIDSRGMILTAERYLNLGKTNQHMFASGDSVTMIKPQSSTHEVLRLEEYLRLGRGIPSGDYWAFVARKVGYMWDQVLNAEPIRIKIEE